MSSSLLSPFWVTGVRRKEDLTVTQKPFVRFLTSPCFPTPSLSFKSSEITLSDDTYEWNSVVSVLSCLVHFMQCFLSAVMEGLHSFCDRTAFTCHRIDCLRFLTTVKSAAMNTLCSWHTDLITSGYTTSRALLDYKAPLPADLPAPDFSF